MKKRIIINGIEYGSFEEIPAAVRTSFQQMLSKFADVDLNGIPDIFEDDRIGDFVFSSDSRIVINDNEYTGLEELPTFVRKAFESVIRTSLNTDPQRPRDQSGEPYPSEHPSWQTDMMPLKRSQPIRKVHRTVNPGARFVFVAIALSLIAIGILFFLVFFSG